MTHTSEELQALGYFNTNVSWRFYLWLKNQKLLQDRGFKSTQRLTLHQVQELWLKLKPNQEPTTVIYKDLIEYKELDESWKEITKTKPYLRYHDVYNLDQTIDPKWEYETPTITTEQESSKPTPKQLAYLTRLIKRKYYDPDTRQERMREAYRLTKQEASYAIKQLTVA